MYKVEVPSRGSSDGNVRRNVKKVYLGFSKGHLKKYYNERSSFAYEIYRHKTSLSNYEWEIKKNPATDPILK